MKLINALIGSAAMLLFILFLKWTAKLILRQTAPPKELKESKKN
jgi:ABC-type transport system involved in cytochrome bd biosynthesis fused ATPase/permease subunit